MPAPREPLQVMGNKLFLLVILTWKLRHWILTMMIWRRGKLDHGGLSLYKARVVMKLQGTPASSRRGSIWHSFVDKTCINESDMSGREVGKALLKLSRDGINEMVSTLPPGVIARFMNLQPKIKTIQEIQTSSSSSSSNGPVEFCG